MKALTEKAMLVKLSISQWTARRYDKKISDEVAERHATRKDDIGRYNKILIAQEAVKKVGQAANAARTFHWEQTLPWHDDGARILPAKNYDRYMKGMRDLRSAFEASVHEFVTNYPELVEDARLRLNGMFNAADYPSAGEIAWKYSYNVAIDPIPAAGDFRVGLADGEVDRIAGEIESRLQAATNAAMKDLWTRLHSVVSKMADRLNDPDNTFKNSLVGNIVELVNLMPALNLTDDPELEAMRKRVETTLCTYNPADLRESKRERGAAARNAKAILDAMTGYMGGMK